jgi:pimeloyl-ACP methyl ester carboxylesterase
MRRSPPEVARPARDWHPPWIDAAHAPRLFLPGFAAQARSYNLGLPDGWVAIQPPSPLATAGSLERLHAWLVEELRCRPGKVVLGGHSMGAALAVLAAASAPEHVEALILIGPAGLPLGKPVHRCALDFVRQAVQGRHRLRDLSRSALELVSAPRASIRLARSLRRLDLTDEMKAVRSLGIPVTVIGCDTDTLVTPDHCRKAAALLGAGYSELRLDGGHVWMFGRWQRLAREMGRLGTTTA